MNILKLLALTPASGEGGTGDNYMIWIMVGFIGLLVVMMIPNFLSGRKRKKAAQEKMAKLGRGDKVMLTNGMIGIVDSVDQGNHSAIVNIGAGGTDMPVQIDLGGIYRIIEPEEEKAREEKARQAEIEAEKKKEEKVVMSVDDIEAEKKREAKLKEREEKKNKKSGEQSSAAAEYKLPESFEEKVSVQSVEEDAAEDNE